jgi:transposase
VAAPLLTKIRAELTSQQAEIVNTLKQQCPGFPQMRELVLGFRTILRVGKLSTLQRWMERALKTGINALERFVRTLKQNRSAVEAAVPEPWSNGQVEGHIHRLNVLKRRSSAANGCTKIEPEPAWSP